MDESLEGPKFALRSVIIIKRFTGIIISYVQGATRMSKRLIKILKLTKDQMRVYIEKKNVYLRDKNTETGKVSRQNTCFFHGHLVTIEGPLTRSGIIWCIKSGRFLVQLRDYPSCRG